MARSEAGVERRPAGVNLDEESRAEIGVVADGVDDATRDLIVHDTTTRHRSVRSKRAHEPLDLDAVDEDQPDEAGNGPRAAEVGGKDVASPKPAKLVSESQLKAGRAARPA